jgi:Lrp/AsnC family transcriptional regulator for asnA, asnC and gidA
LDQEIIRLLNRDARLSSSSIARLTGASERTVRHRMNRLLSEGVLRPVAVVDPGAFGYTMAVDIFCQVDMAQRDEVLRCLCGLPEVYTIAFSTGEADINLQALFRGSAEMHDFITHRLYQIPGILRTRVELAPTIIKSGYEWLPPADVFQSD